MVKMALPVASVPMVQLVVAVPMILAEAVMACRVLLVVEARLAMGANLAMEELLVVAVPGVLLVALVPMDWLCRSY